MSEHNDMMMDLFRSEVESHAESLTQALLALERDSTATHLIDGMMRAAHSVKGAARIVQIEPAVQVAHVMEDCFVAAQRGEIVLQPAGIDVLLKGVDMLSRISEESRQDPPDWGQLQPTILQLVKCLEQVHSGQEPERTATVVQVEETPVKTEPAKQNPPSSKPSPQSSEIASVNRKEDAGADIENTIPTVQFPAYLNSSGAERVRLEYLSHIKQTGISKIILDLSKIEDMDGVGLAFLDSLSKHAASNPQIMVSVSASSPVAGRVLRCLNAKNLLAPEG